VRRQNRLCVRCERRKVASGYRWPEGFVCASCHGRGVATRGRCAGCGAERLLPGLDEEKRPTCADCARIPTSSFTCTTCGCEGAHHYAETCYGCSLKRRLHTVLDDGTGRIAPALQPLHERLSGMANPVAGMNWLVNAAGRLSSLATGETPLSHEGIDSLGGPQAREHLRELLMDTGILPARDKYLAAFDAWRQKRLASIDDPAVRKEIQLYLAWRQMRDLSVRAEAGKLKATAANLARTTPMPTSASSPSCRLETACCRRRPRRTSTTGSPMRRTPSVRATF
jgi:hypothetical protein